MSDIVEPKKPSLAQAMMEAQAAVEQFLFIIFVPNPQLRAAQIWIDDGSITYTMSYEELFNLIDKNCGYDEKTKFELACEEYGTPFFYDRQNKQLRELNEKPNERKLTAARFRETIKETKPEDSLETMRDKLVKVFYDNNESSLATASLNSHNYVFSRKVFSQ